MFFVSLFTVLGCNSGRFDDRRDFDSDNSQSGVVSHTRLYMEYACVVVVGRNILLRVVSDHRSLDGPTQQLRTTYSSINCDRRRYYTEVFYDVDALLGRRPNCPVAGRRDRNVPTYTPPRIYHRLPVGPDPPVATRVAPLFHVLLMYACCILCLQRAHAV
jgi:hypothetical protein